MKSINFNNYPTPIEYFGFYNDNHIYVKRDDLTEPTLGGNKVRKLELFLADAKNKSADYIVTYGSAQSNHCRLTVTMARKLGFNVLLILAKDDNINYNGNYLIYDLYDTEIVFTETTEVPETIKKVLRQLKNQGSTPYFIQGGGHGDLGTHAYKLAFDEILQQELESEIIYNSIFHATGTGTTQAGLVSGNILSQTKKKIIGISIARKKERGLEVVNESVCSYLNNFHNVHNYNEEIIFVDDFIGQGYADIYPEIIQTIKKVAKQASFLLDPVYTGKAFTGMLNYIRNEEITSQNILFIHTGGIPLLFNYANQFKEES